MAKRVLDRFKRQADAVDRAKINKDYHFTVVGCGAGGRQVALTLATMGMDQIALWDPDKVEDHNLCTQGYLESDLFCYKVAATAEAIRQRYPGCRVAMHPEEYGGPQSHGGIVFLCVDSLEARKACFKLIQARRYSVPLLVDGRMMGRMIRTLTCRPALNIGVQDYLATLEGEPFTGRCTSRSLYFCAQISAGLMVDQFLKFAAGSDTCPDSYLNLVAMELDLDPERDLQAASESGDVAITSSTEVPVPSPSPVASTAG